LTEDPSRFAGIRDYAPGDPLRRIHPRASARLGRPVVKRFEPSRDREVLIALDVQTTAGPAWETAVNVEEVESLFVVAASLARSLALERAAFGLAAAGYHGAESRFAYLPVSEAPGQAERVFDLLARLSSQPSARFELLIGMILRVIRPGTTVVVVTARDPAPYLGHLRRLERAGCPVVVVACGPDGAAAALPAAFGDTAYYDWYLGQVAQSKALLYEGLDRLGITHWKSDANFVLAKFDGRGTRVAAALGMGGVYVRDRSRDPGCADCLRMTAGVVDHTRELLAALEEVL